MSLRHHRFGDAFERNLKEREGERLEALRKEALREQRRRARAAGKVTDAILDRKARKRTKKRPYYFEDDVRTLERIQKAYSTTRRPKLQADPPSPYDTGINWINTGTTAGRTGSTTT